MKDVLLEEIKKEYEEERLFQEAYNEEARTINRELKEEATIKLIGASKKKMYIDRRNKKDILLRLLRKHRDEIIEEDTNYIYVYFGTYKEKNNDGLADLKVPYNDKDASYSLYRNLEIDREVLIPIYRRNSFEGSVNIVTGDYIMLQKEFITSAVKKGQDYAAKQIVKKYRRSFNYED